MRARLSPGDVAARVRPVDEINLLVVDRPGVGGPFNRVSQVVAREEEAADVGALGEERHETLAKVAVQRERDAARERLVAVGARRQAPAEGDNV